MVSVNIQGTITQENLESIDAMVSDGRFPTRSAALREIVTAYFTGGDRMSELTRENESLRAELQSVRGRTDERVLILLDVRNVSLETRKIGFHTDYRALRDIAADGRHISGAIAFDGRYITSDKDVTRPFHEVLMHSGWSLDLRDIYDEAHQKEVDVALATALISGAVGDTYDTAVVISGDRDFVPAIEYVRGMGKGIEVMSFGSALSAQMRRVADKVTMLDSAFIINLTTEDEGAEA